MFLKKLIGCEVTIQTGIATFFDIKGTVTDIGEGVIEIQETGGKTLLIPLSSCGFIRVEKQKKDLFKKSEP